jgi:L,D-peptidoglycan transpeptidase YkuD (ErfK/YbiS/YcfS/YnhG family)
MQAVVRPTGWLVLQNHVFRAALGRAGVAVHKREGDGATPSGILPLRRVLYRLDRLPPPDCAVPIEPISDSDGWCDDPLHRDYNRPVRLPHEARCEELWRQDGLYDVAAVLGWNDAPVERGRGSAIFLHVARQGYGPTEGCVALALVDLLRVLAAGVTELVVLPE